MTTQTQIQTQTATAPTYEPSGYFSVANAIVEVGSVRLNEKGGRFRIYKYVDGTIKTALVTMKNMTSQQFALLNSGEKAGRKIHVSFKGYGTIQTITKDGITYQNQLVSITRFNRFNRPFHRAASASTPVPASASTPVQPEPPSDADYDDIPF